jgi:predicted ATPase/transcriptional regulator with XRE-family HTH domain
MAQTEHRSRLGRQAVAAPDSTLLGELLRQHRERLGWSQEELAGRVEPPLSANTVSNLERGRTRPHRHTLAALCDALGLDAAERQQLEAAWHAFGRGGPRQQSPDQEPIPAQPAPAYDSKLSAPLAQLIGRDTELDFIARRLRPGGGVRLLTLVGPGGVGKTHLALVAAERLRADFAHRSLAVDLAPVREPGLVLPTIARALGLPEAGGLSPDQQLRAYLRPRQFLLVLDNLEQVVAAGPSIARLLADCPDLAVLVTSRTALRVRGEHTLALSPLDLPRPSDLADVQVLAGVPAVALFVERARMARFDFEFTERNAAAVAEVCTRLDGLPLALELAAARLHVFSPDALLVRLNTRLGTLVGGARDLPDRQRALRDTLAWSHDLLTPAERVAFRRLAVFAGGWTLAAAEAVVGADQLDGDVAELLEHLVGQSLVRVQPEPDGEPRFGFLETVREYALEQLAASGEEGALRARHCAWSVACAEDADRDLRGPGQTAALRRLERESANLRSAIEWAIAQRDAATALRFAAALWWSWNIRLQFREARQWLEASLAVPTPADSVDTRAWALLGLATLAWLQGETGVALSSVEHARSLVGAASAGRLASWTHLSFGILLATAGEPQQGLAELQAALGRARADGDTWTEAVVLVIFAEAALQAGDLDAAEGSLARAIDLARALGDDWWLATCLSTAGDVARCRGDRAAAESRYDEALARYTAVGQQAPAHLPRNLGYVTLERGETRAAAAWMAASLERCQLTGERQGIAECLAGLAGVAVAEGQPETGARWVGAAERLLHELGTELWVGNRPQWDRALSVATEHLGQEALTGARTAGADQPVERIIAEVLAWARPAEADPKAGPPASRPAPSPVEPAPPRSRQSGVPIAPTTQPGPPHSRAPGART